MKQKRKMRKRIFIMVACAVFLVVCYLLLSVKMGSASAAVTSLPHIEEIIASKAEFHILEVVPEEKHGSFGYYVDGQEPFEDWQSTFSDSATYPTRAQRVTYANQLLTELHTAGILAVGNTTPLLYSGDAADYSYTEKYFWELTAADGTTDTSGWTSMPLSTAEKQTVVGQMTAESGSYDANYAYVPMENGSYVQEITHFALATAGESEEGVYYYAPVFSLITDDMDLTALYGQAMYTPECVYAGTIDDSTVRDTMQTYYLKEDGGYLAIAADTDFSTLMGQDIYTATGAYEFYDSMDSDMELDNRIAYYYVTSTGAPSTSADGTFPYAAASTGFVDAADVGYFDRGIVGYTYVFDGSGAYRFTPDATGESYALETDIVYYQGSVSNNNWFLQHVFDMDSADLENISVLVDTVTPAQLTQEQIADADLIVLSAGFDVSNPNSSLAAAYVGNDLSPALAYAIYDAAMANTYPLIVDYRLTELTDNLQVKRLAQLCLLPYDSALSAENFATDAYNWSAKAQSNFVAENVYCFDAPFAYAGSSAILNLITPDFTADFSESTVSTGFSEVLSNIAYENFLRKTDDPDTTDLFSETVTMANTIRYIINYADARVPVNKQELKVLDLEPGRVTTNGLSKSTVLSWLGTASGYTVDDITIFTMPTAEFIGKIEDLNETYDMVYIGTCLDGFNTTGTGSSRKTNYNDDAMDGLVYVNVGDRYRSQTNMAGLLARDYTASGTLNTSSTSAAGLFRFSGNDLTDKKANELKNFAEAGYPIILADNLLGGATTSQQREFQVDIAPSASNGWVTLSASAADTQSGDTVAVNYQWYRKYNTWEASGTAVSGATSADYTFWWDTNSCYYCVATAANGTGSEAVSDTLYVGSYWQNHRLYYYIASNSSYTQTGTYDITVASAAVDSDSDTISTAIVDSASYMYAALDAVKSRANVMAVSELDTQTLTQYINLSKPAIVFTSDADYPTVYSVDDSGTMTALEKTGNTCTLNYQFSIQNDTDPTPATTTYNCQLYIDLNADGRYSDAEMLDDIMVKQGGTIVYPQKDLNGNEYYALSAGKAYQVSREMSDNYAGIIPWKLQVVKNGAEKIHASAHNYTRIAPREEQKQTVYILQIGPSSLSNNLNLQEQLEQTNTANAALLSKDGHYYKGIYGKLIADIDDFDVEITTLTASNLEALQFVNHDGNAVAMAGNTATEQIFNYLDQYDMLMIGFKDMYGEIGVNSAPAITDYIEGGKSVLFTHDTTSFCNYAPTANWGYYFNTVIRDSVGLDRYGITSDNTVTPDGTNTTASIKSLLYPQTDATDLTAAQAAAIVNRGYNVAYDHNTASGTLPETQGLTNYELIRYGQSYSSNLEYTNWNYSGSARETNYVSQVNEGQITTYPYNINTALFRGTGTSDYMQVLKTHEQYYQLNMNADDTVVWFCLSGGSATSGYYYNDVPYDVINSYYIFTKGNVTYSGVGHTSSTSYYSSNLTSAAISEAKLFVNTMIAAYSAGKQAPTVQITDSFEGTTDVEYLYFPSDESTGAMLEDGLGAESTSKEVYFTVKDTNIDTDKQITASFSYTVGEDTLSFTSDIYQADGTVTTTLKGGSTYRIYLPQAVLEALSASDTASVAVNIQVTTQIAAAELSGTDTVQLQRINLYNLR